MSDNIDKNEIRKAIDRLQLEHPVHFAFDATRIVEPSMAKAVQDDIDRVAKMMVRDASIHIICEMAKLYLDGVKPTVEPKRSHAEWIPCSERLPEPEDTVLFCNQYGEVCIGCKFRTDGIAFIDYLTSNLTYATAWMPLPEPYKKGETNG